MPLLRLHSGQVLETTARPTAAMHPELLIGLPGDIRMMRKIEARGLSTDSKPHVVPERLKSTGAGRQLHTNGVLARRSGGCSPADGLQSCAGSGAWSPRAAESTDVHPDASPANVQRVSARHMTLHAAVLELSHGMHHASCTER